MSRRISIIILILLAICYCTYFLLTQKESSYVTKVISSTEFVLDSDKNFSIQNVDCFDAYFSEKNKILAKKFNISENEAFIIGNLGKYWTKNILENRKVQPEENNLIFYKFGYFEKLSDTPYAIIDGKISNKYAFDKLLKSIRNTEYVIVSNDIAYPINKNLKLNEYVIIKKSQYDRVLKKKLPKKQTKFYSYKLDLGNIKLILGDFTIKLKPDRNCSTEICKEILDNINNAKSSIDIAIYGYSAVPKIEEAIKNAINRGVKIRLVYDLDSNGENIYPNTDDIVKLIASNNSDRFSNEASKIMHNKFYIFDEKIVITGSANLSHTDLSGYNSNSILVIDSKEAAKIYQNEFEQMYSGKFHNDKSPIPQINPPKNMEIYFSPQDRIYEKALIPIIKNARSYIYIPIFVLSEKQIVQELINAKKRGVDVRIIIDALNAAAKYSKVKELRDGNILVKTENFAGKMHLKTMIVDDKYLIIGSMNFSNSGANKNDENIVILQNSQAAVFYKKYFLYQWSKIPNRWLNSNPSAEGIYSLGSCSDGIDNDYDGKIDLDDDACKARH